MFVVNVSFEKHINYTDIAEIYNITAGFER